MTGRSTAFGELLRALRCRAGLTQEELAERSQLSVEGISALERGQRRSPRRETVVLLADALRLGPEQRDTLAALARSRRGPVEPPASRRTPAPRELPPVVADFTGRAELCAEITAALTATEPESAPTLVAVTGMAGVGKTALAIQLGHLAAAEFGDGQLYVDLRGGRDAVPVREALSQVLRSLGVVAEDIPKETSAASARYRSLLAGRRMLVILDDAADTAQVVALLPNAPGCAVIVTGRRAMPELPGARQYRLEVLSDAEGLSLLASIAGPQRVAAEPQAAQDVVRYCGHLPLAIRIAGARLASRPSWPVQRVARRLDDEHRRIAELSAGDLAVRSSFAVSFEPLADRLEPDDRLAAEAFARLSLVDSQDISVAMASRLVDRSEARTEQILEQLVDLNLLETGVPGRYHLHELLRSYALERDTVQPSNAAQPSSTVQPSNAVARAAALTRVLTWYTEVGWRTRILSRPALPHEPFQPPGTNQVDLDPAACLNLLERERVQLVAVSQQAVAIPGVPAELLRRFALGLFTFYATRLYTADWITVIDAALAGSEPTDRAGRTEVGWLYDDLGMAHSERGAQTKALQFMQRGYELFDELGDAQGLMSSCNSISLVLGRVERHAEAVAYSEQSLALSRKLGDQRFEAAACRDLGLLYWQSGDHAAGLAMEQRSLECYERLGVQRGIGMALINLGAMYRMSGRYDLAAEHLTRSITVLREISDTAGEAEALEELGHLHAAVGDYPEGLVVLADGLALATSGGDIKREASIRTRLGDALAALGRTDVAREHWRAALAIYRRRGDLRRSEQLDVRLSSTGKTKRPEPQGS